MRSAEIMSRFTTDTLQLHHELILEHKNAEIQRVKFTSTLAISAALTLAFMLIMWYLYLRKRRFKVQLRIMNLKLDNVRNRISPHFVFNVLNNKIVHSEQQEAHELQELTRLIRANLDISCQLAVTLGEELDFVNQYVKVEQQLLSDDSLTITQVSMSLGFEYPQHFVRFFKAHTGRTPSEYRRAAS